RRRRLDQLLAGLEVLVCRAPIDTGALRDLGDTHTFLAILCQHHAGGLEDRFTGPFGITLAARPPARRGGFESFCHIVWSLPPIIVGDRIVDSASSIADFDLADLAARNPLTRQDVARSQVLIAENMILTKRYLPLQPTRDACSADSLLAHGRRSKP